MVTEFFVLPCGNGQVDVRPTLPRGVLIPGPLNLVVLTGHGLATPPESPMTVDNFATWCADIARQGYQVAMRHFNL